VARIAHVIAELRREGKTVITSHMTLISALRIRACNCAIQWTGSSRWRGGDRVWQEEISRRPTSIRRSDEAGQKIGVQGTVRSQEEFLNSLKNSIDASASG